MFKLFYTLLVIEYVVENQDVSTTVIFPSEHECYEAMGNGVMDDSGQIAIGGMDI